MLGFHAGSRAKQFAPMYRAPHKTMRRKSDFNKEEYYQRKNSSPSNDSTNHRLDPMSANQIVYNGKNIDRYMNKSRMPPKLGNKTEKFSMIHETLKERLDDFIKNPNIHGSVHKKDIVWYLENIGLTLGEIANKSSSSLSSSPKVSSGTSDESSNDNISYEYLTSQSENSAEEYDDEDEYGFCSTTPSPHNDNNNDELTKTRKIRSFSRKGGSEPSSDSNTMINETTREELIDELKVLLLEELDKFTQTKTEDANDDIQRVVTQSIQELKDDIIRLREQIKKSSTKKTNDDNTNIGDSNTDNILSVIRKEMENNYMTKIEQQRMFDALNDTLNTMKNENDINITKTENVFPFFSAKMVCDSIEHLPIFNDVINKNVLKTIQVSSGWGTDLESVKLTSKKIEDHDGNSFLQCYFVDKDNADMTSGYIPMYGCPKSIYNNISSSTEENKNDNENDDTTNTTTIHEKGVKVQILGSFTF